MRWLFLVVGPVFLSRLETLPGQSAFLILSCLSSAFHCVWQWQVWIKASCLNTSTCSACPNTLLSPWQGSNLLRRRHVNEYICLTHKSILNSWSSVPHRWGHRKKSREGRAHCSAGISLERCQLHVWNVACNIGCLICGTTKDTSQDTVQTRG